MKNKLLIIGASGHGKVVADIAMKLNKWQTIAFLDDNKDIESSMGIPVIGTSNEAFKYINDYEIFVGIGNNSIRELVQLKLEAEGASIPNLIHPSAVIGEEVEIGSGTTIMAGAVINCCTNIGKGCIINTSATVDHDNEIGDFVHISPGVHIAGSVSIGKGTWLGIGSTVSNNIIVTGGCIVGASAVVVKDIKESGLYLGVPARRVENGKNPHLS